MRRRCDARRRSVMQVGEDSTRDTRAHGPVPHSSSTSGNGVRTAEAIVCFSDEMLLSGSMRLRVRGKVVARWKDAL